MRAAIYIRVSQDGGGGAKTQRKACEKACESMGADDVVVYEDLGLHVGADRPGYRALIEACGDGTVDVIVASSLDRLVRRATDVMDLVRLCEDKVRLVMVNNDGPTILESEWEEGDA